MKTLRKVLLALLVLAGLGALARLDLPVVSTVALLLLVSVGFVFLLWAGWRLYQAFLWKVGRRLAFSYFLIGVLPIPMVLLLLGLATYILAGFFLGHLFRDAATAFQDELAARAATHLATPAAGGGPAATAADTPFATATYRDGSRVSGDPRLPESWPTWLAATADGAPAFFSLAGGEPTLAAAAGDGSPGTVVVYTGDLAAELSRRSDVWVRIFGPAESEAAERVNVEVLGREMAVKTGTPRANEPAGRFFAERAESGPDDRWIERLWDRPFLWWGEVPGPLRELATGKDVASSFAVSLNAPPRSVQRHLFSGSAEVDVGVWSSLFVFAFLLFDVYAAAAIMAGVMIFALSRAVNRLSRATERVRGGDFSVRIPVRRRDQVGELQRSFNLMAENLEQLVATATQKELLEKELAIARELQKSLIPTDLPAGEAIEFATLFEPSAAIGGDYFDILRLGEDRLAVIVADVSGHGLPTGLRMAMLKSALTILAGQATPPEEILRRLDSVVRLDDDGRFFVTATLALIDFRRGRMDLTNAGHPPTYLLRGDGVREIVLPGSPLGGLGQNYGTEGVDLESGDVVVWLSDGFIEARDDDSEPFGYHGVERALGDLARETRAREPAAPITAVEVRDRLVADVNRHTRGTWQEDDRTLVVMRYKRVTAAETPRVA